MIAQTYSRRWVVFLSVAAMASITLLYFSILKAYRSGWIVVDGSRSVSSTQLPLEGIASQIPKLDHTASRPPLQTNSALTPEVAAEEWDPSHVLKGLPTDKFRDNLLDDRYYITAWSPSGYTNQFMSHVNMIYLGMLSDRVPIIAPFGPGYHISYNAGVMPFGQIFNLSRARQAMRQPLLEWINVKALSSPTSVEPPFPEEREQIGCWSTYAESKPKVTRVKSMADNLRLDIAYTRIPTEVRRNMSNKNEDFIEFSHIVPYIFPKQPLHRDFPIMEDSPLGYSLHPDRKVSCFDWLYYTTSSHEVFEWTRPWSPAWRRVGTHMHFTDELVELTNGYLARAFKTASDEIPLYIGLHVRRGDFDRCQHETVSSGYCLLPLKKFEVKVAEMREILREEHSREVAVVLMSDAQDPKFWEQVDKRGWVRLDHDTEKTVEKHGEWYPPIIDQVAHSMAAGFIGTGESTYSLVGARRVEDWNNGPTILINRNEP